jgi:hypothetical protein
MDALSEKLAAALRARFPGCEEFFSEVDGHLVVEWPSQNPDVEVPLKLVSDYYPFLHWYNGYFCDFIELSMGEKEEVLIESICDFLDDFFNERIICAAGGPVIAPHKLRHYYTTRLFPSLEKGMWVFTWKGFISIKEGQFKAIPHSFPFE